MLEKWQWQVPLALEVANGPTAILRLLIAFVEPPKAMDLIPLVWLESPIDTAPSPLAIAKYPIAVDFEAHALEPAPKTMELNPIAFVLTPMATE